MVYNYYVSYHCKICCYCCKKTIYRSAANLMVNQDEHARHHDNLADRLIEKQQKFAYFFITANTGVIIYSTNFFIWKKDPTTVISRPVFWLLLVGCSFLLLSTCSCLSYLFSKNKVYESYLDSLHENKKFKASDFQKKTISITLYLMFIFFGIGMFINIFAYMYHFIQVHK